MDTFRTVSNMEKYMYPTKVETKFYEQFNKTLPDLDCENKFEKFWKYLRRKYFLDVFYILDSLDEFF